MGDDFDRFLEKKITEQEGGKIDAAWAKTFVFPGEEVVVSGAEVRLLIDALNREGSEESLAFLEKIPLFGEVAVSAEEAQLMRRAWEHINDETDGLAELKAALERNFR
jgi:hypothetical protein